MRREQFEHVIAAAAEVSGEREIVVIGSQAILGNVDEPPTSMLVSMEWDERLVRVEIPARVGQATGPVALCLEIHDLVLAKCAAGRDRDWEFAHDAVAADLVRVAELLRLIEDLPEPPADRIRVRKMLEGIAARIDKDR
ncbi:MAG TPA: hypothetical protein VH249_22345 [Xanthobacteraceae bacterium]|nr:hypothetical protein [Xanthobacteraceae bacterium]